MNMKRITLIAFIGQIVLILWWPTYELFSLYEVFENMLGRSGHSVMRHLVVMAAQAPLALFLYVLYTRQQDE